VHVLGHQYQGFDVRYNYIAYNDAEYRNIITAFGIQLNFTTNIVFANRAQCIVNASVLEKVALFATKILSQLIIVYILRLSGVYFFANRAMSCTFVT